MKKIFTVMTVFALLGAMLTFAYADSEVDYSTLMIEAAIAGDQEAGLAAEAERNEKIGELALEENLFTFEELFLLSKIIYAEAGSVWLSDEWKMCVGEVVLNRVASPEFPNTVVEVLEQPGQYYGKNSKYFNGIVPSERCVQAALRLLRGERLLDPTVVFQANFVQGGGTHTSFYDEQLGWTYFCFSSHPSLYVEEQVDAVGEAASQVRIASAAVASFGELKGEWAMQ